jgi:SET domain-containing protein
MTSLYRPLPDNLELKHSEIHGYGVFANEPIEKGQMLGLTHINAPELIRTPLGGYINHSLNPNCIRIQEGNRWYLQAIDDILGEEEITLMYKDYRP